MEEALLALIVGLIGLGGVFLGSLMQGRTAAKERTAVYLQGHNDRAAETLGQLRLVVAALKPDTLALDLPDNRRADRLSALATEAQRLRTQLAVLSASHPTASVRKALTSLSSDVNAALGDARYMMSLLEQDQAEEARGEPRTTAAESWTKARGSLDTAIALIHETLN